MSATGNRRIGHRPGVMARILRETVRPFQPRTWRKWTQSARPHLLEFPFQAGAVEPPGMALVARLVTESRSHPGPIVEIGTLFGRTTVQMALFKAAEQKIITVDAYTWNPWRLAPECHYELTSNVLHYLCQTDQVEQLRMNLSEFFATYRGPSPALVFLDGGSTYGDAKRGIAWARSAGAALVAGHDYADWAPGVRRAVDEAGGARELAGAVWVLP